MADIQWYYARNDQQFGPVSATELKQLADAGRLTPDDLLWREGMDAWTTAINLRGLFEDEGANAKRTAAGAIGPAVDVPGLAGRSTTLPPALNVAGLRSVLRTTQMLLWGMCVLVVLVGVVLFTRAFLVAKDAAEEAAAGVVFSTFFIGAYVLARCGEKLCRLLLTVARRRSP